MLRYLVAFIVIALLTGAAVAVVGFVRSRTNGGFPTHESSLDAMSKRSRGGRGPSEPPSGPNRLDAGGPGRDRDAFGPATQRMPAAPDRHPHEPGGSLPSDLDLGPGPERDERLSSWAVASERARQAERTRPPSPSRRTTGPVPAPPPAVRRPVADLDPVPVDGDTTDHGLPRRRPRTTTGDITSRPAATLRADRPDAPVVERSPEELRAMLARYQQRSRTARTDPVTGVEGPSVFDERP